MVNAELVRLGYAQVMTVPPNVRHAGVFRDLQREARAHGRGLWGVPGEKTSGPRAHGAAVTITRGLREP